MKTKAAWLLIPCALALGCSGTRIVSGGPFAGVVQTQEGTIRYSLAKTQVVVDATVTLGASGKVSFNGTEFVVDTKLARKDAKAAVSFATVPDEDQFFTLRLEHGQSADDSMSVEIGPNGMLRSIGVSSTSQIGNTIRNVATIVGSVVAGIVASTLSGDPKRKAAELVCEQLGTDGGSSGRCGATPPPKALKTPKGTPPATLACEAQTRTALSDLSLASLYFLARSPKNRRLWLDARDAENVLADRTCKRTELERTVERASGKDVDALRSQIRTLRELEETARTDLRTATVELDSRVRSFQLETGLDGEARTEKVHITFDLDEIPPPDMLRRAISPSPENPNVGMSDTDVRAQLKAFPKMLELYDRTGIALTLTAPPYVARGGTVWGVDTQSDAKTRVYYRPSYTAVLTTYATTRSTDEQGAPQELLRFFSTATDDVIHPKMPVQGVAFEPAAFADRKLALSFDGMGRLVRFEQAGRSSLSGATSAGADAIRSVRDEVATTLSRIAEIQDTKRSIEQNDTITEIDRLKKQKELLDARLELSGTRAGYDLVLEKKRIDAQLGLVQSKRALADERGGGETASELEELRERLEALTREVQSLKAQPSIGR